MAPTSPDEALTDDGQMVDDPGELIRIVSMLRELKGDLWEVDLDAETVDRVEALHDQVIDNLEANVEEPLVDELRRFVRPVDREEASEADVRIAHLLLVGWLEGLFQGLQLNAVGRQMREQTQTQRAELRRQQQERRSQSRQSRSYL